MTGTTSGVDAGVPPAGESCRVLLAFGVLSPFYEADTDVAEDVKRAILTAYSNLSERFGATVQGTFDDFDLMVGPSPSWPWTSYILADVPSVATATALCNLIRTTRLENGECLWKYISVEARIGKRLFFGND